MDCSSDCCCHSLGGGGGGLIGREESEICTPAFAPFLEREREMGLDPTALPWCVSLVHSARGLGLWSTGLFR